MLVMTTGEGQLAISNEISSHKELKVKAVLIYKFLNFITWPSGKENHKNGLKTDGEITVGFFVDPQMYKACTLIDGNSVKNRRVKTVQLSTATIDDTSLLDVCDVVFISRLVDFNRGMVFSRLKGRPVLTFGETEDFLHEGGMIHVYTKNNKVQFDVGLQEIHRSGFKVKAQLLKLARKVIR